MAVTVYDLSTFTHYTGRDPIASGNDVSLAATLRRPGVLNTFEQQNRPTGPVTAKVPVTAPETLAEGEFNRFYIRGLCQNAINDHIDSLVIYRARNVSSPRPESEAKIGQSVNAQQLLQDLRTHPGVDTALGIPAGPNSGLSVRRP